MKRFWIPFFVSIILGIIGGIVFGTAADDWKWGAMFGLIAFIAPYLVAFAYDVAIYDKRINSFDIACKTVFGKGFVDPIRFKSEFSEIVEILMEMEFLSNEAVQFTKTALKEMVNNGIIRIGCGKGDYFKLIKQLSKKCRTNLYTTYYYPEVSYAMPTWLIEAPDNAEEKEERQGTVKAYSDSLAKNKVRMQFLTPHQFKELQETKKETMKNFLELTSGFRNYYGQMDEIDKDSPNRFLFEDYVIFDDIIMLHYDYGKGILTMAWTGEKFKKAKTVFESLDNLKDRGILKEISTITLAFYSEIKV